MINLVITSGESFGIGLDAIVRLAENGFWQDLARKNIHVRIIADPDLLIARAKMYEVKLRLTTDHSSQAPDDALPIIPIKAAVQSMNQLESRNADYVLTQIQHATTLCLNKQADAMVTAPIHKATIAAHLGQTFEGHTSYLATLCEQDPDSALMMFVNLQTRWRALLLTTHCPLQSVSTILTAQNSFNCITQFIHLLKTQLREADPRLFLLGLNPHAGENGTIGQAEIEIFKPLCHDLRQKGIRISDPISADSFFFNEDLMESPQKMKSDACIIAPYHDQILPIFKYHHFEASVNLTLGLPFIRTSVDHGTACDKIGRLAPQGAMNLAHAVQTAVHFVRQAK